MLSPISQMYLDSIKSEKQIVSKTDTIMLDTYIKIKKQYQKEKHKNKSL